MKYNIFSGLMVALFLTFTSCQEKSNAPLEGSVFADVFESEVLDRSVQMNRYFPPAYNVDNGSYPLLILLHGHGGDQMDWFEEEEGNAQSLLDSLINNRIIPPVLAVSAHAGNSWYVNAQEPMEDFFLQEWIPSLQDEYKEIWDGTTILAGDSAGGYGSLRFALIRPELFQTVILLSPAAYHPVPPSLSSSRKIPVFAQDGVFNDSIWNSYNYPPLLQALPEVVQLPKFYLSVGDDDAYNIVPVVAALQQEFLARKIVNELRITNGGHDWECWKLNFAEALAEEFRKDKD